MGQWKAAKTDKTDRITNPCWGHLVLGSNFVLLYSWEQLQGAVMREYEVCAVRKGDFMVGSLARAAEAMVGDHLSGRQMLF